MLQSWGVKGAHIVVSRLSHTIVIETVRQNETVR